MRTILKWAATMPIGELLNKDHGVFDVQSATGVLIKGQVRHIQNIDIGKQEAFILARNNDSVMVVRFSK